MRTDETYEQALDLYADGEFCWNCAALLDHNSYTTVGIQHHAGTANRTCCSPECAARAVDLANEPALSVREARERAGLRT